MTQERRGCPVGRGRRGARAVATVRPSFPASSVCSLTRLRSSPGVSTSVFPSLRGCWALCSPQWLLGCRPRLAQALFRVVRARRLAYFVCAYVLRFGGSLWLALFSGICSPLASVASSLCWFSSRCSGRRRRHAGRRLTLRCPDGSPMMGRTSSLSVEEGKFVMIEGKVHDDGRAGHMGDATRKVAVFPFLGCLRCAHSSPRSRAPSAGVIGRFRDGRETLGAGCRARQQRGLGRGARASTVTTVVGGRACLA